MISRNETSRLTPAESPAPPSLLTFNTDESATNVCI